MRLCVIWCTWRTLWKITVRYLVGFIRISKRRECVDQEEAKSDQIKRTYFKHRCIAKTLTELISLCENCMTGALCCSWCVPRLYLLMSRGLKWAFRRDVMTPEMILTFWTVTSGSESLNSSFGSRPTLSMTAAFLLSLMRTRREKQREHQSQSVPTDRKSNSAIHAQVQSCSSLQPLWLIPLNIALTISIVLYISVILMTGCCKCWQKSQ